MEQPQAWPDDRFINRELSWIQFNERVLSLAEDQFLPVLERAKFLAIFASNLDEFYMVRVAGLKRQVAAGFATRSPDGLTAREQLEAITHRIGPLVKLHAELFSEDVMPILAKNTIEIVRFEDLESDQIDELSALFRDHVFPVVTPLAVDPAHPFPYISNRSLNLAVLVHDPIRDRGRFARVKVPPLLPRFVELSTGGVFVPLEDVIAANLDKLFPGMSVLEHHAFRVTRDVELDVDDDGAEDLLQTIEEELRKRRISPAVRLEIEETMPQRVLDLLIRELQIGHDDVHALPGPLALSDLWEIYRLDRPDLKDQPYQPVTHPDLTTTDDSSADMFSIVSERDILIHHPYESFATSVQAFIEQAGEDPDVLAIKQTLYRTSVEESPIVEALIEAAEGGKQVVVLVELRARFDEHANIRWARTLEKAGCHVVYGVVGLKTHCKLCLIVRREPSGLKRYVHVGTGNYNPRTARLYEDLGLLTADPELGADVSDLFNFLTGYSRQKNYRNLIVAPYAMREKILAMIAREASLHTEDRPGQIILKLNALVDEAVIDGLYAASQAGVRIDLIVRGICALRPAEPGLSENITVRSILGRYLEHSRILYFDNGGNPEIFIGSADLMHRNLDRRVEVFAKVNSPEIQAELKSLLDLSLTDNVGSWRLQRDGTWERVGLADADTEPDFSLQGTLMSRA